MAVLFSTAVSHSVDNWKLVGVRQVATQALVPSAEDIALLGPVCAALVLKHRAELIAHAHRTHLGEVRRMRQCECDEEDGDYSICGSCKSFNALRDSPLVPTPWVSFPYRDADVRKTLNIPPPTKAAGTAV
jgi:hypothetical protein